MGRYVPPDIEGTKQTSNALHRRRAPGTTRRTTNADGTTSAPSQTVRFEMPFPIWCSTCPRPTIIGQGVRFNARKTPAGKYHSTTVWRFDMRHAACGGEIAMQTDPKNTAYVVLSGATKRSPRDGDEGDLVSSGAGAAGPILTDAEREDMRQSAFSNLEKTIADRERMIQADERISTLLDASSRHWDDPYAQNQRLRKHFRVGRKQREADAAVTEALQDRMGLDIELLPESEEDRRRAALVDFMPGDGGEGSSALAKPLFGTEARKSADASPAKGATKSKRVAAQRKDDFVSVVMGNTRATRDPFLKGWEAKDGKGPSRLPGVKRKRDAANEDDPPPSARETPTESTTDTPPVGAALVDYDSD